MTAVIILKQFATIIIFFFTTTSFEQFNKEKAFIATLQNVVTALSTRDSVTLSKYTDRKTGIFILNRIGVFDTYKHKATLGFSDTTYPNAPFYDNVKFTPLQYATLPIFDCEKWTKTGTFVDTTYTDHLLSEIARDPKREFQKATAKAINEFYNLENKSRRVVIADNNWNELIIYLSFINNKWVLTIIDKVTCDCSV
jgi:hypothetical protein